MLKTILVMILAVVSSSAMAEWVVNSESETSTAYADPVTIRKSGDRVKMWELLDFKSAKNDASGHPYRSAKARIEYDCKEEQERTLFLSFHSGNMGGGETVFSASAPQNWEQIPPGSLKESLWRIACGKQ